MTAEYPKRGRFRLKIVEVEAFCFHDGCDLPEWFTSYFERWPRRIQQVAENKYDVSCQGGWRILEHGRWCVMRPSGGISVIDHEDFIVAYEPVPQEEP